MNAATISRSNVSWPFNQTFTLTMLGRLTSGSKYTPTVQGDINGDGSSHNDRAFVYDAATTSDTGVINAMSRMLSATSAGARSCIQSQLGTISGRNSCTGPWSPSLEFQVNILPPFLQHRLTMSLATSNFLGGLDEFLHGEDGVKGWGQYSQPNSTLMTVTGFDPASKTFKYQVNERFGATSAAATATRAPMQLQLRMRYVIGYDQQRARMSAFFTAGANGAPSGMDALRLGIARFETENIIKVAMDRKDSLALSPDQMAKLQTLLDSTKLVLTPLLDSLTKEVDKVNKAGTSANIQPLIMLLGPLNQETVRMRGAVRAILTDVQWSLLPEAVRNGTNFFNVGGGLGGGGRGGGGGMRGGGGGGRGGGGGGE